MLVVRVSLPADNTMSWLTFTTDFASIKPILIRIADALDRLVPLPEAADETLKPEEAVTYVDEDALAKQEAIDELGADAQRINEWLKEHPEFEDALEEPSTPNE